MRQVRKAWLWATPTEHLAPVEVVVNQGGGNSGHATIQIPAVRVLTGTLTVYDPAALGYVPVQGALVRVPQLGITATTNAAGRFMIGELPAGSVEVNLLAGKSSWSRTVNVPMYPSTVRADFRISSRSGRVDSTIVGAE